MSRKFFARILFFFLCLAAVPPCFSEAGKPLITTKTLIPLPLKKSTKSVVCVNRNFNDTQKFGNAFCAALDEYSFDCVVKLAEFVPKEAVVGYDYVWTFQVKKWTDKNLDGIPENVSAVVYLYDKDFNLLLKSSLKASNNKKDPQAPNCLELLVKEYINSLFNDIVEVKQSESAEAKDGAAENVASDKPAKEKKAKEKPAKEKKEKPAKKEKAKKEKPAKKAAADEEQTE